LGSSDQDSRDDLVEVNAPPIGLAGVIAELTRIALGRAHPAVAALQKTKERSSG
jgi:hypothetical protein